MGEKKLDKKGKCPSISFPLSCVLLRQVLCNTCFCCSILFIFIFFASPWDFGDFMALMMTPNYWRRWKVFHSISHAPHQLSKSTALKRRLCWTACVSQDQVCIKQSWICISCCRNLHSKPNNFPNRISTPFLSPGKEWERGQRRQT